MLKLMNKKIFTVLHSICLFIYNKCNFTPNLVTAIVVPAKSDNDIMFCLQSYQGLVIDRSLVYYSDPQDRIATQVIYRFALAQGECTRYFST